MNGCSPSVQCLTPFWITSPINWIREIKYDQTRYTNYVFVYLKCLSVYVDFNDRCV